MNTVDTRGSESLIRKMMAFTLIELLVVVAIIGILFSLLLPALAQARRQGRQGGCINNLRQIGMAAQLYAEDHESYPPAWVDSQTRWMDLVKPFLEKKSSVYLCPDDAQKISVAWDSEIHLSYGINTFRFGDQETCFWYGVRAGAVCRPSETILFADCTPGKYYCGGGGTFMDPVPNVDYRHGNRRFTAVFCDGHTQTMKKSHQRDWDASH